MKITSQQTKAGNSVWYTLNNRAPWQCFAFTIKPFTGRCAFYFIDATYLCIYLVTILLNDFHRVK